MPGRKLFPGQQLGPGGRLVPGRQFGHGEASPLEQCVVALEAKHGCSGGPGEQSCVLVMEHDVWWPCRTTTDVVVTLSSNPV